MDVSSNEPQQGWADFDTAVVATTMSTSTSSPRKQPSSRRESIQDKVKRRSILEGLSSFQIPGASGGGGGVGGHSVSDVSEALSVATSVDDANNTNANIIIHDDVPVSRRRINAVDDDPAPIRPLRESKDNINSANGLQQMFADPQQQQRQQHQQQRREQRQQRRQPRRSSLQETSTTTPPNVAQHTLMTSKSVRFQFEDNRIVKAGELSSHNRNRVLKSDDDEVEEKKEEQTKVLEGNNDDDKEAGSKVEESKHKPVDKQRRTIVSPMQQSPKRATRKNHVSLSDLGYHADATTIDKSNNKTSSNIASRSTKDTATTNTQQQERRRKPSSSKRSEADKRAQQRMHQSMGNMSTTDDLPSATVTAPIANQLERLQQHTNQVMHQSLGFISLDAAHNITPPTTAGQNTNKVKARRSTMETSIVTESSQATSVGNSKSETSSLSRSKRSSSSKRNASSSNSSSKGLSSTRNDEAVAKRKGRRKQKSSNKDGRGSQRMHQSLRSFGSSRSASRDPSDQQQQQQQQQQQRNNDHHKQKRPDGGGGSHRMHQSLRSFGSSPSVSRDLNNDQQQKPKGENPNHDTNVDVSEQSMSLFDVDIDIKGMDESSSKTRNTSSGNIIMAEIESQASATSSTKRRSSISISISSSTNNKKTEMSRRERRLSAQKATASSLVAGNSSDLLDGTANRSKADNSTTGGGTGTPVLPRQASTRSTFSESQSEGTRDSRGRSNGRHPDGRNRKSKVHNRLQMHKSIGAIGISSSDLDELGNSSKVKDNKNGTNHHDNNNTTKTVGKGSLASASAHQSGQVYDTPPLATNSLHGSMHGSTLAAPLRSNRNSTRETGKDIDNKLSRRGSYHHRMIHHQSLNTRSSDNVDANKQVGTSPVSQDQDIATSRRSSWNDREGISDQKSTRGSSVHKRSSCRSPKASGEVKRTLQKDKDWSHRLGGSSRNVQNQRSPTKRTKKKVAPSQDTDTTMATSTTAAPSNITDGDTPPQRNRRKLMRKNSSMNDLRSGNKGACNNNVSDSMHHGSSRGNDRAWFHKSLRHVDGEPCFEEVLSPAADDLEKSKSDKDRGRRRRSSVERTKSGEDAVEARARTGDTDKQASRRARSRSKSQHGKLSSKGISERAHSQAKSRARSKSRHDRKIKPEAIAINPKEAEEASALPPVPKHIFLEKDEGASDESHYSSIEGVSIELERKKAVEKEAKAAAAAATAKLNSSLGRLDLQEEGEETKLATKQVHRLDMSTGDLGVHRVQKKIESGKRSALLHWDSDISTLGFPPQDRKKRAAAEIKAGGEAPPMPEFIMIVALPSQQSNDDAESPLKQSNTNDNASENSINTGAGTDVPPPGDGQPIPRWKNRLSTHSILNVFNTEEISKKAKSEYGGEAAKHIQSNSRNLLLGITEQKMQQAPKEKFWNVLSEAFKPDDDHSSGQEYGDGNGNDNSDSVDSFA